MEAGTMVKDLNGTEVSLGLACAGNPGNWVCLTHQQAFQSHLQVDLHEETMGGPGAHEFIWNCHRHGLEA